MRFLFGVDLFFDFYRIRRKKLLRFSASLSARAVVTPVEFGHGCLRSHVKVSNAKFRAKAYTLKAQMLGHDKANGLQVSEYAGSELVGRCTKGVS